MRRQTPVANLLHSHLFPYIGPADPPNFQTHLARDLIPEIRIETATFYGSLDSIEARYPGLNYCHAPHRMRLGRFPHHARLFAALDELGITDQEIMDLARWEGTLWARQRFERDKGIKVRDTIGTNIEPWVDPRRLPRHHRNGTGAKLEMPVHVSRDQDCDDAHDSPDSLTGDHFIDELNHDVHDDYDHDSEATDDASPESSINPAFHEISRQLDYRLLASLTARSQGANLDVTPELEAYLKDLIESGHFTTTSRPADGPISRESSGLGPSLSQPSRQPRSPPLRQSTA